MPDFTIFRLHDHAADFDSFVDLGDKPDLIQLGPVDRDTFTAKLYVTEPHPHEPAWTAFLKSGFQNAAGWWQSSSVSALLIVHAVKEGTASNFALAFGPAGRHLLKENCYRRRYGLITALNIISDSDLPPRLRALDTARHSDRILRSRLQTTGPSGVEAFELDLLRDLVRHATGEAVDTKRWGLRVGGSDALRVAKDLDFDDLGAFCLDVDTVFSKTTYKARFDWIDHVTPIEDDTTVTALEKTLVSVLKEGGQELKLLQMAPPEVVDWDRLQKFTYHSESRAKVRRPDVSLDHYLKTLSDTDLSELDAEFLHRRHIKGFDSEDNEIAKWSVWRCLTGEIEHEKSTYVLDDGSFYQVEKNFLAKLNSDIAQHEREGALLPPAKLGQWEADYNKEVADKDKSFLCLDAKEVPFEGARGGIELCDLLTRQKQLIHVKRYTSSATLSHLFNQARTSAELLTNGAFRGAAKKHIAERDPEGHFAVFEPETIDPREFEVVIAIVKRWDGLNLAALPFFAKMNFRRVLTDISGRLFRVSIVPVSIE